MSDFNLQQAEASYAALSCLLKSCNHCKTVPELHSFLFRLPESDQAAVSEMRSTLEGLVEQRRDRTQLLLALSLIPSAILLLMVILAACGQSSWLWTLPPLAGTALFLTGAFASSRRSLLQELGSILRQFRACGDNTFRWQPGS